jgi:uncharacterized protein (TIGR03083 family)
VDVAQYVTAIEIDGRMLGEAVERAGWHAPVPTCPGWQVRDLVRHLGHVHRRVAGMIVDRVVAPPPAPSEEEMLRGGPPDTGLLDWFSEGCAALAATLRAAPADLAMWTFLEAPSPLAFWARRQAHETAIHRVDAESAAGEVGPFPPAFAADGVDELLMGFLGRGRRAHRSDPSRSLAVHAADTAQSWLLRSLPDRVEVSRHGGAADCTVSGRAVDLYLFLWNRRAAHGLDIVDDLGVLGWWRRNVRITWS